MPNGTAAEQLLKPWGLVHVFTARKSGCRLAHPFMTHKNRCPAPLAFLREGEAFIWHRGAELPDMRQTAPDNGLVRRDSISTNSFPYGSEAQFVGN